MGGGSNTRFLWVLDPIDGTKSFITGDHDPELCARWYLPVAAAHTFARD